MKKVLLLFMAFALALACTREENNASRIVEWTFDTEYSKASVDGGVFSWQAGDRIDVWNATSGDFVTFTTIAGKGRFMAMAPANAGFSLAAFYPAGIGGGTSFINLPSSYATPQLATAGFPMFAAFSAGDQTLHFKHLGAVVTITVNRVQPELTRLELRSASTPLSGRFDLTTLSGDQVIRQKTGSGCVTVAMSFAEEGTLTVSLPVPTGSYPISICLGNEVDNEMLVINSENALTFDRAHHYILKAFDYMTERYAFTAGTPVEGLTIVNDSSNW